MSSRDEQPPDPGPPQAVVIIHGIGEQRPMATLRNFVSALLDRPGDRPGDRYYSKPDTLSDSYELRRIKLHRADTSDAGQGLKLDWPATDFYEYYWAHQMYGTTVSHVVRWLIRTLRYSVPFVGAAGTDFPRLRWLAIRAWLAIAVLLCAAGTFLWLWPNGLRFPSPAYVATAAALVLALWPTVWAFVQKWVLGNVVDVVGDAARYFDVNPKNVARRYDILRGGIALLRKLHEDREVRGDRVIYRYGRIVLVGHSLGSVIAYDILRHYWGEVNGRLSVDGQSLAGVEGFVAPAQDPPFPDARTYHQAHRYWRAQDRLWKAISRRVPTRVSLSIRDLWGQRVSDGRFNAAAPPQELTAAGSEAPRDWQPARWLVSDLVTVGSPLAYAPVLLATGQADLVEKLGLRELPTCPPDRSRSVNRGHYSVDLHTEAHRIDDYPILHHGACFAPTRWTNLWYHNDPVGGPLRAAFGRGVRDICLTDAPRWPLKSHTSYWRLPTSRRSPKGNQILEVILRGGYREAPFRARPPA